LCKLRLRCQMPQALSREEKSNGKCGLESKAISSTFTNLLLMSESHTNQLSSKLMLIMNGLVILQPPEERSNGKDITTTMLHISTGLQKLTNMM